MNDVHLLQSWRGFISLTEQRSPKFASEGFTMKSQRARSTEQKQKQLERILTAGREVFLNRSKNFSMRQLAKQLEMSPGNLYNYVRSKRELWFAIIEQDFEQFDAGMRTIINNHQGTYSKSLDHLARYYFEFALADTARYQMMFSTPAPPARFKGPFERSHEVESLNILIGVIQHAVDAGEITGEDTNKLAIYFWSVLHGVVMIYITSCEVESVAQVLGDVEDLFEFTRNKLLDPYHNLPC